EALIHRLAQAADIVLFDTPPCLPVTDATLLSTKVDGVLLVANIGAARRAGLKYTKEQFERAHARLVGLVFNKVSGSERAGQHYYYYHQGYYGGSRHENGSRAVDSHKNGKLTGGDKLPALTGTSENAAEPPEW